MQRFDIICPCHFGLEAVLKREIQDLGYEIARTEDGRVIFHGDADAVVIANIHLRTAERVMIDCAEFEAKSYNDLFEGVKAVRWEEFIPKDGKFWVKKASSVNSKLYSPRDIQSIVKKAMVDHLSGVYGISRFEESGSDYPLRVFINKDRVTLGLDTSGDSLHKRGYRKIASAAPLSETIAAGLIRLTPFREGRILIDPFCGSGTIPIEAAMMIANIAPGLKREFTAEHWSNLYTSNVWQDIREEAEELIDTTVEADIQGYDIDSDVIKIAKNNAEIAGVGSMIHFQQRDVKDVSHAKKYGFIVTNPPYGERLMDKDEISDIYSALGNVYKSLDDWSMYVITSFEDASKYIGRKADKNRKIYNGMIKTYYYQYLGKKPPKKKQ